MKSNKLKIAYCKCGCGGWKQLSTMPEAEIEDDIISEFKAAVIAGSEVAYITRQQIPKRGCLAPKKQLSLFEKK